MGVQDKHRNLLSSIAIPLLICLFVSQAIASHLRVCSQTRYRRILLQPVSTLAYTRRSRTVYTSCGFLWLSRCSSVSYYSASTTAYRSRYGAETYKHLFCCSNFIGTPPNCVAKACSLPVDPANGYVAYSSYIYNSIARYTCNMGYQLQGSASQRCQADGHWSGSQPTCEIIHCPRPSGFSNGDVSYTSTVIGSSATFTCNSGYERVGSSSRTCQSYGQWNGSQPFCLPVICPSPSQPSNGDVSYSPLTYQSIAFYSCSLAYKLIGPVTRTCQPNKTWSETDPTCQRKTCPELSDPANGEVEVPSMFMGDTATYSCSYGYRLIGSSSRTCQSSEIWTRSEPHCSRISCQTITNTSNPDVSNVRVKVSSYYVDGVATYYCMPRYELIGSSIRTCETNGKWSGNQPSCQPEPEPILGFEKTYARIDEGESLEICLTNYSHPLKENVRVELKTESLRTGSQVENLLIPPQWLCGTDPECMCFNVTAVDDDRQEGYDSIYIILFKLEDQRYQILEPASTFHLLIVDNDGIEIGFEESDVSVEEEAGEVQLCVKVQIFPNGPVSIKDVILEASPVYIGEAKYDDDYIAKDFNLAFTNTTRLVCFKLSIVSDTVVEGDEQFDVELQISASTTTTTPIVLDPARVTVTIKDDDGVQVGFEKSILEIKETDSNEDVEVCVIANFPKANQVIDPFTLRVNSHPIIADEVASCVGNSGDYEVVSNHTLGPFSSNSTKHCFHLSVCGDRLQAKSDKSLALSLTYSRESANVVITRCSMFIKIIENDEKLPCDHYLRIFAPELFEHCTSESSNCIYKNEWSTWSEEKLGKKYVKVPKQKCGSEKIRVISRHRNADSGTNCTPETDSKEDCVPLTAKKLLRELGVGNNAVLPRSHKSKETLVPTSSPQDSTGREKRSSHSQQHCYEPNNVQQLYPNQCRALPIGSCPHEGNQVQSRNSSVRCNKRSILFVVDSSGSIGEKLFSEVSNGLSRVVKDLCGDIQFALLKYSIGSFVEFCFDCYKNDQRDKLRTRIKNTEYIGYASFTGYATTCANNFMFNEHCGKHDERCIDIVYLTDGESNDRSYFNVCDQIECLHKNPAISDRLKVYAVGVDAAVQDELKCITRFSKRPDESHPVFEFENLDKLIAELNKMLKEIGMEQHEFWKNGKLPESQCSKWIDHQGFDLDI